MAEWMPYVEFKSGDTVGTPHGDGTVRRVSENGSAQVDVDGQLFEVQLGDMSPIDEKKPEAGEQEMFKVGDNVELKSDGDKKGKVTEVTQRTIRVKFNGGGTLALRKTEAHKHIKHDKSQPEQVEDTTPLKVGDRVVVKDDFEDYKEMRGVEGTVKKVERGGSIGVELDEAFLGAHDLPTDGKPLAKRGHGYWFDGYSLRKVEQKPETKTEEKQERTTEEKSKDVADDLYGLFNLQQKLEEKIDREVDGELKDLREQVKKSQKLEVVVNGDVHVINGLKHKQLEQLIKYAALRLSPLLVGMAGTGKTHAASQVAEALSLPFYSMSVGAQTSKSDIVGYMDASGNYVRTHFRDAYEHGGIFLMDEIDAGNANVLIQINAALSNGLCSFPDMMVQRHDDFIFIASANTYGNGANRQYVGRNQLDAATLDRFAVIDWLIDDELEKNLAVGLNAHAWYMAVRATRDYIAEKSIRALVSPRATQKGSKLLDIGCDVEEVIDSTLLSSVPDDKKSDVKGVAKKIFEKFASKVPSTLSKTVNAEVADLV